jgi:hypothetical protein
VVGKGEGSFRGTESKKMLKWDHYLIIRKKELPGSHLFLLLIVKADNLGLDMVAQVCKAKAERS